MSCPVEGCKCAVQAGSIFCPDHYILLPVTHRGLLTRVQVRMKRTDDAGIREHLASQLPGYIRLACEAITQRKETGNA